MQKVRGRSGQARPRSIGGSVTRSGLALDVRTSSRPPTARLDHRQRLEKALLERRTKGGPTLEEALRLGQGDGIADGGFEQDDGALRVVLSLLGDHLAGRCGDAQRQSKERSTFWLPR